jgi:hypothetical protein
MADLWPWLALIGLGAFHGLNPAMGWLFAVALGLQARSGGAVLRALAPIALGHAASIALVVAGSLALGEAVPALAMRLVAAFMLVSFGVYRLATGYRHRMRVGMVAGFRDLVLWSFLMATAHGAGLMIVPVLLALPAPAGDLHAHAGAAADFGGSALLGLIAVAVHTAAMLAVVGLIAWTVYAWVGLAILRRGWINLDLIWSGALIAIGLAVLIWSGADILPVLAELPHAARV